MPSSSSKTLVISTIAFILFLWIVLTVLAQRQSPEKLIQMGEQTDERMALVVFNPDMFYNLDEQVCSAFAKGLSENGWQVKIATVAMAEQLKNESFNLYAFCANTYNWAPDRPTQNLIKTIDFKKKPVVALTLGSGSTVRAKRILENLLKTQGGRLLASKEYWLMRPNDPSILDMTNVKVATEKAFQLGRKIGKKASTK